MMRHTPDSLLRTGRKSGFTLIELLVVISIIALLIGILLPALGAARNTARTAVCLGNLRSAGQAMATYAASNKDWLAGPNTSGFALMQGSFTFSTNSPTQPTQNLDWVSPTLGDSLGLPGEREDRVAAIFNDEFRCPTNALQYTGVFEPGSLNSLDPTTINYSSYSAMLGFHVYPAGFNPGSTVITIADLASNALRLPQNYAPRLDRVGSASSKVYAMDGARFVTSPTAITFNGAEWNIRGGNFMAYGPSISLSGDPYQFQSDFRTPTELSKLVAFRHSDAINGVFFDGHASTMQGDEANNLEFYFPSGSDVLNPVFSNDKDYPRGTMR